jgi:hypothetical protein
VARVEVLCPAGAANPPGPIRSDGAQVAAKTGCGKTRETVILRSPPFLLADDEGSAQLLDLTTAGILLPQGGIRMTAWGPFPAA